MMIIEVDQFHSRYRPAEMGKLTLAQRGRLTGLIHVGMTIREFGIGELHGKLHGKYHNLSVDRLVRHDCLPK